MSGGGFSSIPYGSGPYGGPSNTFGVESITPVDNRTIDVAFSNTLSSSAPNFLAIANVGGYAITPTLLVVAAVQTGPKTVRVFTLPQSEGALYRLEVLSDIRDASEETLSVRVASWTALAAPVKFLVDGLESRSECVGQSVYLKWTNRPGTTHTKIVRRLNAWPFDLTDEHDVVYEGAAVSEFYDTGITTPITALATNVSAGSATVQVASSAGYAIGDLIRVEQVNGDKHFDLMTVQSIPDGTHVTFTAPLAHAYVAATSRVSKSTPLQPQTYYYYLVLASDDAGPSYTYDIDDSSRVMALSIGTSLAKAKQFFLDNTPRRVLELDAMPLEEGGGAGFLDKWFSVMACWLNEMRGHLNAIALMGDPDKAPFHVLTAKNQALGIDPEGFAYDLDIVRRPLTSLAYVYKRRGTCQGIVDTVRMFTKWDAECHEYGFNQCAGGSSNVKTWDGVSLAEFGTETNVLTFTMQVTSPDGAAQFVDSSKAWSDDLWKDGTIRGALGDVACVDTNVSNQVTMFAPRSVSTLSGTATAGTNVVPLTSTVGLVPGLTIQLISATPTLGVYPSEIVEVLAVTPGVSITTFGNLVNTYPAGSKVAVSKSIIRREILRTATAAGQVLTDASAKWVTHQWKGYKLLDANNVLHNITANTGTTITVDGAAPPSGAYSIAYDFTVGASFNLRKPLARYKIWNREHTNWFEPTLDLEARGTVNDPYNRLWNGPGANLTGVYGPNDVAAYILTKVPVTQGFTSTVTGFVFTLDPSQPAPGVDAWKGYFLNPNQNQDQLFEILANDATTLTVAGDIASLVVPGQYYYILKPRDKVRFQRITKRLRKEFTDTDVRIHVLFI